MSFYAKQSTESGDFSLKIGEVSRDQIVVDGENRTKLIVNYLPQTMREEELHSIFSRCGQVLSAKIIRDAATNYSFGYGFVEYSRPEDAARAIDALKGYPVQNKRLGVTYSRVHNREDLKNTNLYVANLPTAYTNESSLRQIFGAYGKIINVKILRDERTGQLRGTAFVRFDRKDQAETAISALNGKHLTGSTEPLAVKVSEEHGKQKAVQIKTGLIPAPLPIAPAPHPYFESYSGGYSNQSSSSQHFGVDSLTLSAPYFDPGYRSRSPTLINPAFFSGQQSSGSYGYLEERSRGGGPMRGERDGSRWNDRQGSSGGGGHYDRRGNGREFSPKSCR